MRMSIGLTLPFRQCLCGSGVRSAPMLWKRELRLYRRRSKFLSLPKVHLPNHLRISEEQKLEKQRENAIKAAQDPSVISIMEKQAQEARQKRERIQSRIAQLSRGVDANAEKPLFRQGKKKIYFPTWRIKLVRHPKLPPNWAAFFVPRKVNKLDIRDYLWSLYRLHAKNIRTLITAPYVYRVRGRKYRFASKKKAFVEMNEPFVYPPQPQDLAPWQNSLVGAIDSVKNYRQRELERFNRLTMGSSENMRARKRLNRKGEQRIDRTRPYVPKRIDYDLQSLRYPRTRQLEIEKQA